MQRTAVDVRSFHQIRAWEPRSSPQLCNSVVKEDQAWRLPCMRKARGVRCLAQHVIQMDQKALNLRERPSLRRALRRARAFDDYSNALRRYYELMDRRSRELAQLSPPLANTAQRLEDARIIWTAARSAWIQERLG